MPARRLRLSTRGSPLALWQAHFVAQQLQRAHPGLEVEVVTVETIGDKRQDQPVWELGGQGVFVKEVQAAVLDGRADLAVHSAKDLPSQTHPDLSIGAVPVRADPRDALVCPTAPTGSGVSALGPGAVVATGSVRRRAQLAWLRPDLTFTSLRGNIATRLDRIPSGGAIVMAAAALQRLGLAPDGMTILEPSVMLPQVAQGAIAVEGRADDAAVLEWLQAIDDPQVRACVEAERAFLARLGGGCDLPVGAHCRVAGEGTIRVEGLLASLDGRVVLRADVTGAAGDGPTLGAGLADQLLAAGGASLIDDTGAG